MSVFILYNFRLKDNLINHKQSSLCDEIYTTPLKEELLGLFRKQASFHFWFPHRPLANSVRVLTHAKSPTLLTVGQMDKGGPLSHGTFSGPLVTSGGGVTVASVRSGGERTALTTLQLIR